MLLQAFEAPATQSQRAPTSPFMQKQLLEPGSPFPGQHSSDFGGLPSRLGQSQSWSGVPPAVWKCSVLPCVDAAVHPALSSACRQVVCRILPAVGAQGSCWEQGCSGMPAQHSRQPPCGPAMFSDWTLAADSGGPNFWNEGLTGGQQRMAELMRMSQGSHLTRHSSINQHPAPGGFQIAVRPACHGLALLLSWTCLAGCKGSTS